MECPLKESFLPAVHTQFLITKVYIYDTINIHYDIVLMCILHESHSMQFLIDGVWFPVDCICGAGMTAPYLHFHQKFTRYYFAVRPDNLILSHIPVEPEWQLLENIATLHNLSPMISPSHSSFCLGIQPLSWAETMSTDPENKSTTFKVSLEAESNIHITAELRKLGTVHCHKDQATYIERKCSNVVDVYATAPGKGQYFLDIHAHCNGESSMCLSYMVNCATNQTTYTGFPRVYRLPSVAFGFKLLYWNTPQEANVCENNLGKMDLIFQCLPALQFHHCLLSGKDASGLHPEIGSHYYCTTITTDLNDHSLHKLSVIFPDKGWWTVYLSAARKSEDVEVSGYTTILNYRVFAKKSLSRCCYPHVQSSDVRFELSEPISCNGTDVLTVPFFSKKKLCLYSCLCYENLEGIKVPEYTLSQLLEDATTPNEYKYSVYAVFPKPGRWYVRVFAHALGQQTRTEYLSLFDMCFDVNDCMENAVFPLMKQEVTEKCNISLLPNKYLVTFCDKQDMFSFQFQAPKNINFDHYIEPRDDNIVYSGDSAIHRYCTYLHVHHENDTQNIYELQAVFPTRGKWSVVICAGESLLSKPEEAIQIPLNISSTLESQVFPAIHPPLREFGVRFSKDTPLYTWRPESPEFEFEFLSPKAIEYAWTLKDVQTQRQFQHSTNVYLETKGTGDILMQRVRVVFPKPGMWLVQVVARTILTNIVADNSLSLSLHYQPVFDLIIEASNASLSQMAFPRVYEPFHSKFGLDIVSTDVPIPSYFRQLPATCTIKFYSPTGVVFWHMCKEFSQIKEKKITRMTSNPDTGLHELYADISRRGQWTVYLYAKFANDTSNNWIAVLQHSITAKPTRTTSTSSLLSRVSPVPHLL